MSNAAAIAAQRRLKAERRQRLAPSIGPLYRSGMGCKLIARHLELSARIVRTILIERGEYAPGLIRQHPAYKERQSQANAARVPKWKRYAQSRSKKRSRKLSDLPLFKRRLPKRDRTDEERRLEMERYYCDVQFRMRNILRKRINKLVKRENKSASTERLIGCSYSDFIKWIEAQWETGMDWSNHRRGIGGWHIDHIIPMAAFDLSDPEQQRRCCHYTNQRPMWGLDNIRKGARHEGVLYRRRQGSSGSPNKLQQVPQRPNLVVSVKP